jgi:hypothetical protein
MQWLEEYHSETHERLQVLVCHCVSEEWHWSEVSINMRVHSGSNSGLQVLQKRLINDRNAQGTYIIGGTRLFHPHQMLDWPMIEGHPF